jgi:hypothetical protein
VVIFMLRFFVAEIRIIFGGNEGRLLMRVLKQKWLEVSVFAGV